MIDLYKCCYSLDHIGSSADDNHGNAYFYSPINISGYDIQGDHLVAGWLNHHLGNLSVRSVRFVSQIDFLDSGIVGKSDLIETLSFCMVWGHSKNTC